jgi:Spy/CpxP family protein refolding chaperone
MKRTNLMRFGAVAAMAAGMAFAQAPAAVNQQAPAGQQEQRLSPQERRERFQERMTRELNLTPAQQQEAKAIFGRERADSKPIREQLRQNREALQAAIQANNTSDIHTLTTKQAMLQAQMMEMHANAMAKFYTTLTPEQRVKAQQMHERMRQRWEQQREHQPS